MKIFRKTGVCLLLVLTMLLWSTGCDQSALTATPSDEPAQKMILCANFAEYDWAREILGDNPAGIDLQLLNVSGMDMHSYQPSVSDMVRIASCDLLIYTGGMSEFWVDDSTDASMKQAHEILSLLEYYEENPDLFPVYEQDHTGHDHGSEPADDDTEVSGAPASEPSADSANDPTLATHDHASHDHSEIDEHLWLSLKMAARFCQKIADEISGLDPDNAAYYQTNASVYIEKLHALDHKFEELTGHGSGAAAGTDDTAGDTTDTDNTAGHEHTLLFADRYPFKYLMDDYGITCVAAFPGCSAETEASFDTIISLATVLAAEDLDTIVVLKASADSLARTVMSAAERPDTDILILDPIQSVSRAELASGYSYLEAMEANYGVLAQALHQ